MPTQNWLHILTAGPGWTHGGVGLFLQAKEFAGRMHMICPDLTACDKYGTLLLPLKLTTLWADSADDNKLIMFFLIFPRK